MSSKYAEINVNYTMSYVIHLKCLSVHALVQGMRSARFRPRYTFPLLKTSQQYKLIKLAKFKRQWEEKAKSIGIVFAHSN